MIRVKRAYEAASGEDGVRILVDRLWPRGLSKEKARIDRWAKELAPSPDLRKWFAHDPEKWEEFQRRYRAELGSHSEELQRLADQARHSSVTLVYGARSEIYNQAVLLKSIVDKL